MDNLALVANAIFSGLTSVYNLFTTNFIFQGVFTLWVLRKIVDLFEKL